MRRKAVKTGVEKSAPVFLSKNFPCSICSARCSQRGMEAIEQKNTNPNIRIHLLEDVYPMGEERAMVRVVNGKAAEVSILNVPSFLYKQDF